ncbi:MarR family transcriptional regulator [Nocardia sp. NPDC050712]|uniref:MarR family winged helix-turn-helix transcriptional regulator n=1 Tax=Nocardia sp. NPDC050712 TaxID=3155518 RepID=UPI0033D89337
MSDAIDLIAAHWNRERPDVDVTPMAVIGRITRLAQMLDNELKKFFNAQGLEFWEFDVLATLRRSGGENGLTAGALNSAAMRTSGAITNRVDRLSARGLVTRAADPNDRRAIRVQLTPEGRALVDELLPVHMANEQRLLAGLGAGDQAQLADLLRALAESMGDTSLN